MFRIALLVLVALLFPIVVVPLGWLVRRVGDPLRLGRPHASQASHFVPAACARQAFHTVPTLQPKEASADEQETADA